MKKLFSILFSCTLLATGTAIMAQSRTTTPPYLYPVTLQPFKIIYPYFIYHGYRFDISQVFTDENFTDILIQLERQVYYIDVLLLPPEIQDFFKSIPVVVAPEYSNHVLVLRSGYLCELQSEQNDDPAYQPPYFLVSLLYSFLDERLPQGINNPDLVQYFNQAKSLPCYQEKKPLWIGDTLSYSSAIHNFFASSATAYLRGDFWQAPYSCHAIYKNQSEFFKYLTNIFGPDSSFLSENNHQYHEYHGFYFNYSQLDSSSHLTEIFNECDRQVRYIERAGLPPNIMEFLKTIPLKLQPRTQMPDYTDGEYFQSSRSISLCSDSFYDHQIDGLQKPTLLHECLHAFGDQCLPNGDENADIKHFFQDAQQHKYYELPGTFDPSYIDYLLTNEWEFFACTATTFLLDFNTYEPFNRNSIYQHQPEYYRYLQNLFLCQKGYGLYNPAMEPAYIWIHWANKLFGYDYSYY